MKKIFYFIAAVGIAWGIVSCDNEPKNPGDFSIQPFLNVTEVISQTTGKVYPLDVESTCDTVFFKRGTRKDTTFNEDGSIKEVVNTPIYAYSKVTTHFIEYKPITFPLDPDTFAIEIESNAKWLTQRPKSIEGNSEYFCINTGGGGNSTLKFYCKINPFWNNTETADLYIWSSDSTVMVKIPMYQEGLKGE